MVRSNLVAQGDEYLRRGVNQATQTINGMNILSWMQGILQNIPSETSFRKKRSIIISNFY